MRSGMRLVRSMSTLAPPSVHAAVTCPARGFDPPDCLMARHDRQRACRQVPVDDLEIRATDGTRGDAEQ
jgi:hypothetical protein